LLTRFGKLSRHVRLVGIFKGVPYFEAQAKQVSLMMMMMMMMMMIMMMMLMTMIELPTFRQTGRFQTSKNSST